MVNSFFAGIGGFDRAFEKLGFKIAFQCEINDYCCDVLKKHWPEVLLKTDIQKLVPEDVPDAKIWCGGFPCQDLSVARGSKGREGLKGKNSGLFYNFISLIKDKQPEVVLLENVVGLLSSHNGYDFQVVIESLTKLGYGVSWRVLNSRYFGVPQSRPRVYICAWKNNLEKAVFSLHEYEASLKPERARLDFLKQEVDEVKGVMVPKTAYCLAATTGRHTGTDWSRTYVSYYNKVRRLTPSEAEKLQGFPSGWTLLDHNTTIKKRKEVDSLRYHAVGNAVSVPVVIWVGDRIKKVLKEESFDKGIQATIQKFKDFQNEKARTQFFSELNTKELFEVEKKNKIKWKSGGLAYGDKVMDYNVHHCISDPLQSSLIDIIDDEVVDSKYFISPSAAIGILRRVDSQNRTLFSPLRKALERMSKAFQNINHL